MTQVDFYVLADQARDNQYSLACRLAEKAWQSGHRVLIWVDTPDEAKHMDRLLWTYREPSFVPHGLLGEADAELNPILIGQGEDKGDEHDVLINLSRSTPLFFSRFSRVIECVDKDPELKAASRARFKFYRDHGYPMGTHNIQ